MDKNEIGFNLVGTLIDRVPTFYGFVIKYTNIVHNRQI
jgi:hypothetical protein